MNTLIRMQPSPGVCSIIILWLDESGRDVMQPSPWIPFVINRLLPLHWPSLSLSPASVDLVPSSLFILTSPSSSSNSPLFFFFLFLPTLSFHSHPSLLIPSLHPSHHLLLHHPPINPIPLHSPLPPSSLQCHPLLILLPSPALGLHWLNRSSSCS